MKLKAELHCHTYRSKDSNSQPEEIIEVCQKKGINCLAITDHNEIDGAFELEKKAPFKIIIGEEIATSEGEIIGYFLKEKIASGLNPEETISKIKSQGGLAAVPHPFDYFRTEKIKKSSLFRIINSIDMIEVFNSRNLLNLSDKKARDYCIKKQKVAIAGSDAHLIREIGTTYLKFEDYENPREFLENIKKAEIFSHRAGPWGYLYTALYKLGLVR